MISKYRLAIQSAHATTRPPVDRRPAERVRVTCLLARTLAVASVALMSMSSGLGAAPQGAAPQVEHLLQKNAIAQMGLEGLVEDIPDAMIPMRDGVRLSTAVYIP